MPENCPARPPRQQDAGCAPTPGASSLTVEVFCMGPTHHPWDSQIPLRSPWTLTKKVVSANSFPICPSQPPRCGQATDHTASSCLKPCILEGFVLPKKLKATHTVTEKAQLAELAKNTEFEFMETPSLPLDILNKILLWKGIFSSILKNSRVV